MAGEIAWLQRYVEQPHKKRSAQLGAEQLAVVLDLLERAVEYVEHSAGCGAGTAWGREAKQWVLDRNRAQALKADDK